MFDNQLFVLIDSILNAGLQAIGQGWIYSQQSNQPTQEGANTAPTLYYYKIGPDQNIGQPERIGVQGEGGAVFTGSITGSILTVTAVAAGALAINQGLSGAGIVTNLIILSQISGDAGGIGTYQLNQAPTDVNYQPISIPSESMESAGTWVYTETQQKSSRFQMSALATQDPANTNQLTASDIANLACYVLQTQQSIALFEAQNVGILRIPEVKNPYFIDDRVRYEADPSFDFTLTHAQTIITSIPVVAETEFQIFQV